MRGAVKTIAVLATVVWASLASAADQAEIVDLEIGKSVDLRQFGGPNMDLTVTNVDISELTVVVRDYTRMTGGGSAGSYSYGPASIHKSVKKDDGALLFRWGKIKVSYHDDAGASMNHIKLAIAVEH